ncbi:Hpt domain-containing protein [Cellvibrio sp. pealriver]|uniref:hybrid sensor histidine kinase/response regulator n=1 Tax=Cellvibrio sp. pealriver TaxID=1622269 RepID=UPI00066FBD5F|nr:Hpt domain-containing protein [Cellvibrio sp. pealriver]
MADNRNFAALDWLIHEISETLKEARQALESYVENPKDATRIRFCLTHIHQVHGSLQMVEFYGAAMLASEMEQLTQAMVAGTVANNNEAQEVLMRAILQFPLYLEQVKSSRKDNPLVVLPLLNDLRAVRGESLLTDTKLFVPNLTPAKKVSGARLPVTQDNVQFQAMVLKLRQMYQYAASGFIRGVNPEENLAYLQKAFSRLQKLTHGTARFALWDISLALVEAIEIDAIEISVAVKNLLRQLDKEIKVLAVHGIKALNSFTNDELIKNLLYYVARAGKHAPGFPPNSQLQRVYETYQLEEALLEGKEGGEDTENMLSVPDAEAMRSVVGALKEELTLIKNSLDICLAGGDTHTALGDALPIVKRVADTMAVLGLGDLRKRILEQGAALDLVVESNSQLTDDQLLAIASQLISIENALDGLSETGSVDSGNSDDSDITLSRAKESVLRESRNGLEHAKDAIIEYIASQWNRQHLQTVPTTLREIRGGLDIIPLPRPARILGACARFIEEQLLEQEATPQWSTLDTLADAITSVEYYLERLSSGGRKEENDLLLSVAEDSVASLGYAVAKTTKSEPAAALEPSTAAYTDDHSQMAESSDDEAELAAAYGSASVSTDDEGASTEESGQLEAIYAQAVPEHTPEEHFINDGSAEDSLPVIDVMEDAEDEPETALETAASRPEPDLIATNNAPVIQRDNEDIDDEIIEIFIEEASETTETIAEYFPRWAQNFDNAEALTEFRRAFHTLKGSGRMVGANEIGELAWSIENMLNRVIDRTIIASAVHVHIIEKVRQLLPGMIAAFRDNQPYANADLAERYREQAHSLAQGITPEALLEEMGDSPAPVLTSVAIDEHPLELADEALEREEEAEFELEEDAAIILENDEDELDYAANQPEEIELADLPVASVEPIDVSSSEDELIDFGSDEKLTPSVMTLEDQVELVDEDQAVIDEQGSDEQDIAQLTQAYSEYQTANFNYQEAGDEDMDDPDAQLWDIFGAEALTHLQVVEEYIARMEAEAPIYEPPSEGMQRALHTLKGSAHMAEVTQVAELATPLERFVKELRSYHVNINDDILQLLRDAVSYTQTALHQIEAGQPVDIPRLHQFIARVHELRDIHIAPLVSLQELDESGKRPVDPELLAIFMAEEMNLLLDADKIIAEWAANPSDAVHLIPVMDELGKLTKAAAHAYLPAMAELSEKIHSVYEMIIADQLACSPSVCDTLNHAHVALLDMVDAIAAGQNLNGIPDAVNDALDDLLSTEAVTLSTLINDEIPVVEDVTFEELVAEAPTPEEPVSDSETDEAISLADLEYEAPEDMVLEDVSLEQDKTLELADEPLPLIDEIELVEEEDLPLVEATLEFEEEPVVNAEEDDIESFAHSTADDDFDPEIVEIFLEEAGELLEEIDGSLNEWQDDWNNSDCVEQLKRSLHTFKGGARLAGLMDLGDLSHDFETILIEMDEDAELDQSFFNRLHSYQDRLHSGVERAQARMNGAAFSESPAVENTHNENTRSKNISTEAYAEPPVLNDSYFVDADTPPVSANDDYESADGSADHDEIPMLDNSVLDNNVPAYSKPTVVVDNTREQAGGDFDTGSPTQKPNVLTFAPKAKPNAPVVPGSIPGTEYGGGLRSGNTGPAQVQHLAARRSGPQEVVKVSAELLEELVNLAGETSISRGRMEQQVSDLGGAIEEMDSTIQRLQEQLRRLDIETEAQVLFRQEQMAQHEEFDPLEMDRYSQLQQLSRSLIESASDLMDLKYTLADKTRDTETLLLQQSRINTDLQEGLMRSRMVPFSRLVPRLRRIVRQAASELGKEVDFELDNVEGELDRTVLERMVAPLEHMLRNAVDHGIEMPDERIAAGKNPNGRILLTLGREGGDVIIRLIDDGRGINLKRVREKAVERGLMAADAQLADQDVIQFILHAGFSTAEKVTQISGRGVGMDVVHSEIKQLGGAMFIDSNWGSGTEFTIRLPFTVSVNRALMVQIGDDLYAIPLNSIEGIVRVSPFELEHYYQDDSARFDYAGENYLVRYLGSLLDSSAQPKLDGQMLPLPVVLVRSAEHTVALQVDRLLGSREIVVKTLGAQFSAVRGVSGATVMGDGSVVVILDLHAMIREQLALGLQNAIQLDPLRISPAIEEDLSEKTIMVVDDSVTVRKVTGRFLEREGFRVISAKDGVEALQLLQDHLPDVMLLDIEMPRMDGFEVAKNIRTSSRLKDLPIIMITSRTGEKHRERAFSLGVNKYMGKPYQEDLLLTNIHELLGKTVK